MPRKSPEMVQVKGNHMRKSGEVRMKPSNAKSYKNITVDDDVQTLLIGVQDKLESSFGFKPSQSQVIRYLVKNFNEG